MMNVFIFVLFDTYAYIWHYYGNTCTCLCIHYTLYISIDRNSTESDVPVRRNLSYATTPLRSTGSGSQATQATRAAGQSETDAAADYSRIGPSYQTVDSRGQQPAETITGRDRVSVRLSERYEFSEAHLAAAGGSDSAHGVQGDMGVSYEVPQNLRQIEEHEEYSHLQH